MTRPRLSIIIVSWNTSDLLRACLTSAHNAVQSPDYEWIVVDNNSHDGSPDMVTKEFPTVRVIRRNTNGGFSVGSNDGLRAATGHHCMLLNSDTEISAETLSALCDYLDSHPKAGAVGPRLLNPDGTVQASCRTFPGFKTAVFHRKSLVTRLFPNNRWSRQYLMTDLDRTAPSEVDWIIGAALVIRREALDAVGLLDEGFFMYAEDVDWCWRIRQAGYQIVYLPTVSVLHHYEKSAGKAPFRTNFARHRSMWRFYMKHYSKGIALLDVATFLGILMRLLLTSLRLLAKRLPSG